MLGVCWLVGCDRLIPLTSDDPEKWDEEEQAEEEEARRKGPLRPGVYVLTAKKMSEYCETDPSMDCQQYDEVPAETVLHFEERLPKLLANYGYADVAPKLDQYVRQYWGVLRSTPDAKTPKLTVFGNFVCRSFVEHEIQVESTQGSETTEDELLQFPFMVDTAERCRITATFPADDTDNVGFWE